jgi:release factor glutamine methyltransferase
MDQQKVYKDLLGIVTQEIKPLPDKPNETPQKTLETLWFFSCGYASKHRNDSSHSLPTLDETKLNQLKELIHQRSRGIPLAYIVGNERFMEVDFKVDNRALIPRKETEILGYSALNIINEKAKQKEEVKIIDLCTGMGNLALAFAYHQPKTKIWASDLSEEAIALANENVRMLGLEERVSFFPGDMFQSLSGKNLSDSIDVITCNPPYISTAKVETLPEEISSYEPKMAFNGGSIGIQIILRLIHDSVEFLQNEGWLCFEVGLGQGPGILKFVERNKYFFKTATAKNENGDIRAIMAQIKK